jgi:hypothetical protein
MKKLLRKLFIPEANPKARIVSLWFQMINGMCHDLDPVLLVVAGVLVWFVYLVLWGNTLYDQWLELEREKMKEKIDAQ